MPLDQARTKRNEPQIIPPRNAVLLIVAGVALSLAILIARHRPATEYEVSIYAATPSGFWILAGIALLITTSLSIVTTNRVTRGISISVAGLGIVSIVSLPIIRGYHYYGEVDAFTHLGVARDIATGAVTPLEVLYPATHLLAVSHAAVTDTRLELSMMIGVPIFVIAFLLFVPITIRIIEPGHRAVPIGAIAAMYLLPINWIAVHLQAHPSSQAILFSPVIATGLLLVVFQPRLATMTALVILLVSYVLIHPMHGVNVVAMVGAVGMAIVLRRRQPIGTRWVDRVAIGAVVIIGGLALFAWIILTASETLMRFQQTFLLGLEGNPAGDLTQQLDSLATIGAGAGEIFVKLFLVSAVFCVVAGLLMGLAFMRHWVLDQPTETKRDDIISYLAIGFLPIAGLFAVYFFAGMEPYEFRQLGFAMAIVTIIGAVAIARVDGTLLSALPRPAASTVLLCVLIPLLIASVLVIHSSPFIFLPSAHVPEAQVSGFETSFEFREPEVPMAYVRSDPARYSDAIHGEVAHARYDFYGGELDRSVPDRFADRDREPIAYRGLRFTTDDFDSLDRDQRIDRLHSNGQYDLYRVGWGGG